MDTNQPTPTVTPTTTTYMPASAAPGMFGTKVPSSVAFGIAVLLFLLPFVDIKCNGTSLQTISGVQLATGFTMKNNNSGNSMMNDLKPDGMDDMDGGITKTTSKKDKKDPNMYAMIALGLGIIGLLLTFTNAKAAIGGSMITGIAAAGAMIGLMLDVKKKVKMDMPDSGGKGGLDDFGSSMTDKISITVDFTPWFYIAVIAFLAAAFFCYKRMTAPKI